MNKCCLLNDNRWTSCSDAKAKRRKKSSRYEAFVIVTSHRDYFKILSMHSLYLRHIPKKYSKRLNTKEQVWIYFWKEQHLRVYRLYHFFKFQTWTTCTFRVMNSVLFLYFLYNCSFNFRVRLCPFLLIFLFTVYKGYVVVIVNYDFPKSPLPRGNDIGKLVFFKNCVFVVSYFNAIMFLKLILLIISIVIFK